MIMKKLHKNKLHEMYFDNKMTLKEIGKIYRVSHSAIAKRMDKFGLKRRDRSEATYAFYNKSEHFCIGKSGSQLLKNIGLMLYWCEGTNCERKNKNDGTLAFTNTNPDMLKIWIKFLRDICGLDLEKIRVRIYLHKNQDGARLKKYWSKHLRIPLDNFENISYTDKISTKPGYKGTVKIKVHNIKLFAIIKDMIKDITAKALLL